MKKILLVLVLIFAPLFISNAYTAEGLLADPLTARSMDDAIFTNYFSMIVTSQGELIAKPGTIFTVGQEPEGTQLAYLIDHSTPISYPATAVSQGLEGKLVLALEILPEGTVGRYQIMRSTGHEALDQEAIRAVKNWKFQAAMKNGKPVTTCIQLPISFQIEGK